MTSRSIIQALTEQGVSQRAIAAAIGRDSSLISQVSRGRKPGANLEPALRALQAQVQSLTRQGRTARTAARQAQVPATARRTTAAGTLARVRKPATVRGPGGRWTTTTIKRQAARSGGRGLGHPIRDAAQRGQSVAVTVGVSPKVTVNGTSGGVAKKAPGARSGRSVTMELGSAEDVWGELQDYGGDFTELVVDRLGAEGYITYDADLDSSAVVDSIELRTY